MHSLSHDIPRFLIPFLEELFLIFNQMLNIQAFGRRDLFKLVYYPMTCYAFIADESILIIQGSKNL